MPRTRRGHLLLAAVLLALAPLARAGLPTFCSQPLQPDAAQHDRLLRFGAALREELQAAGRPAALVARSGTNLERLGQRYSHAGISLQAGPLAPWSVRQLYYACDESRSRLYDQGLPAFVLDFADPRQGHALVLLPPPEAAAALARAAADDRAALALLEPRYNAASYPFDLRDQNCNQWVAELLAAAWGPGVVDRASAQRWLRDQDYRPTLIDTGAWRGLELFIPWVDGRGQPPETYQRGQWQVSLPATLEALVLRLWPETRRVELCHDGRQVVVRRDGAPMGERCEPAPGDRVVALD
jgi:hypothetical protein